MAAASVAGRSELFVSRASDVSAGSGEEESDGLETGVPGEREIPSEREISLLLDGEGICEGEICAAGTFEGAICGRPAFSLEILITVCHQVLAICDFPTAVLVVVIGFLVDASAVISPSE